MQIIKFVFSLCTLSKIYGKDDRDFIADYFVYKNVPSIIAFSCSSRTDNLLLARKFNKLDIRAAFFNLDDNLHMHHLMPSLYWKQGIFLDTRCYNSGTINWLFSEASDKRLFGEIYSWLVLGWDLDSVIAMIDDEAFSLSTDFVVGLPVDKTISYELYDAYNPWKEGGGQLNVTHLGSWSESQGLDVILRQSKFFRRANLGGISMRAAFFGSKYRPKTMAIQDYLQDYTTQSKDGLSKFGYHILIHLSEMFNISFKFGEVQVWMEGDTLGPLSRALVHNEIQITGSPVVMTTERLRLIKFVYPTWPFRTCFIFRNPQPKDIKIDEVLRPFTNENWYLMVAFLIIFEIILVLSFRFENENLAHMPYSNSFLVVIGALCQQGTNFTMEKVSTRIVFTHVLIFSLLTYNYYSASIVSARLNEPIFKINDSLNELVKTGLTLASEPMIYFNFLMKRLPEWQIEEFYKKIWLKIPENERFMYPENAISRVQEGGFAYHTHPDISYPMIDKTFSFREICELMEVHVQHPIFATMAVTYNTSFLEMTKIGFAKMSEVGIRHRQLTRWSSNKPRCRNDIINASSTDIYEFAPHLIILVIGMILAFIILIFEKLAVEYNQTRYKCVRSTFCTTT